MAKIREVLRDVSDTYPLCVIYMWSAVHSFIIQLTIEQHRFVFV